jgi:hypothetical protein
LTSSPGAGRFLLKLPPLQTPPIVVYFLGWTHSERKEIGVADVNVKARVLGAAVAALSLMVGVAACSPDTQEGPSMSPEEQARKESYDLYRGTLESWLESQGVDTDPVDSPIVGTWTDDRSTELYVFSDSEFTWYKDEDDLDDNYYIGTYEVLPGGQTLAGFVLEQGEGLDAYSAFLHYTAIRVDGVDKLTNYDGLFMVTRQSSPDSLYINNQRTGEDIYASLVVA